MRTMTWKQSPKNTESVTSAGNDFAPWFSASRPMRVELVGTSAIVEIRLGVNHSAIRQSGQIDYEIRAGRIQSLTVTPDLDD